MIPWKDVEFFDQLGKGHRKKRKTQFLEDEQEPVRGRKQVKAGHGKAKAIEGFKSMMYRTTNKEYNDIIKMLMDHNVSNEDALKKLDDMQVFKDDERICI